MFSSRFIDLLRKIDSCESKSKDILNEVTSIYLSNYITGLETSYIKTQKNRIEDTIEKLRTLKYNLLLRGPSDDNHLFYYEKEVCDIEELLNFVDK